MKMDMRSTELLRDVLLRLYDPPALATAPLSLELVRRGIVHSSNRLFDALIGTIDRMKPPESAPPHSHGWCCYRYLQLRYVDCCSHASIAQALHLSPRQASRIHHDALGIAASILLSETPSPPGGASALATSVRTVSATEEAAHAAIRMDSSLKSELSRIGSEEPEEPVQVLDVVTSVFETLGRIAETRGVYLQADVADHLPAVQVNRVALRQILLNALLYLMRSDADVADNPSAGSRSTVSLRASAQQARVTIDLQREGGPRVVAEDNIRGKESESLLAAVKHLAQLQSCDVRANTDDWSRSTLQLVLPALERPLNMLVLDDNPDVGELFQRMLAGSPYHLVHVRTAARALKLARENRPSVILLDVVLPVQDGWEVLAALRADPHTMRIPVVVCSVLPDRDLALSLGAIDFLAKPVTRASLLHTLSRVQSLTPTRATTPALL